jgi:hypothetical protein
MWHDFIEAQLGVRTIFHFLPSNPLKTLEGNPLSQNNAVQYSIGTTKSDMMSSVKAM